MARSHSARIARAAAVCFLTGAVGASAQQTAVPPEGLRDATPRLHALTNARIVIEPGREIARGTVVLRDGLIISVDAGDRVPAGAVRRDLGGKTVYAGFVEIASTVGVPANMRPSPPPPMAGRMGGPRQAAPPPPAESGARHWNRRVRPERDLAQALELKADDTKALRNLGFAAALSAPDSGILRGQSALIALRESDNLKDLLLASRVFQHLAFETANGFGGEYPGSLMGSMALIRQSLLDAQWQRDQLAAAGPRERPEANLALDALQPVLAGKQPVVFDTEDELDIERALRIANEFRLDAIIDGNGTEYRVTPTLVAVKVPVLVPLNFPAAPEIERPASALNLSLAELQHWEQAPANAARLSAAGITIALTTRGLKDPAKEFWPALRRAVAAGLSEQQALRALTTTPAQILGQGNRLGKIANGQIANLIVADAELFRAENASIYEVWIDGVRHEIKKLAAVDPRGEWTLTWSDGKGPAKLSISGDGPYEVKVDELTLKAALTEQRLLLSAPNTWFGGKDGSQPLTLVFRDTGIEGLRALPDGTTATIRGQREGSAPAAAAMKLVEKITVPEFRGYPAGEYARLAPPAQPKALLVRNATIWTMGPQGRLEGADMLVRNGRIAKIGPKLDAPSDAVIIDGSGMHLAPGIVDAHSHAAISRNLNEPSHAVTTEVRISDALDPTDISIYRQLAGGVTSALLLHGSANPMGGQSQTVKWRWGADAEGLKIKDSTPGVKFALGENVKQANWGDAFTTRYPQSRMGVEQLMIDSFNAAKAYGERADAWRKSKSGPAPRRDLRLDALLEILRGERLVHIHSYRQDEVLMFVRLAQRFGLKVATFQHILEGYKVADALASINAGASTFADWWAFKMEVYDAIPYNVAILNSQNVLTSLNSDSDEMARRLNAEAGKMLKYGGLDELQALALVTINPARQLRIDDRVGSLEEGKDADFALWNMHPLSSMARVEQTWIEGRKYFDRVDDAAAQLAVESERARIVAKALPDRIKAIAAAAQRPAGGPPGAAPDRSRPQSNDDQTWAQDAREHGIEHWAVTYGNQRRIYHNGEDVIACSVTEHGH